MGKAARRLQVDGYLENLRTQRQLSKHTVVNYGRDLVQLLDMSEAPLGERGWAALSHFHVRKFTAQLHAGGLNARSIARKLSSWRGFFEWLAESDRLSTWLLSDVTCCWAVVICCCSAMSVSCC